MAFTFFFRDRKTLELIAKSLVPHVVGRSRIKIWDAGCAMGPEPYSLAIILAENMGEFSFKNIKIYATDKDTNDAFGPTISKGVYPEEQLKRIPKNLFNKYFSTADKTGWYKIEYKIKNAVQFKKHDLLSLQTIGSEFSLVMCKNVLLHFSPRQRIDVIKMFYDSLAPGGLLAMEQTQKLPDELNNMFEPAASGGQILRKLEQQEEARLERCA